ncbi:hypothetical protein LTR81_023323 [Elasticomyces elasticus]
MRGFAPNKRPLTLKEYYALALRFVAYLHRITQGAHCHFDIEDGMHAPENVVQLTAGQQQAWQVILESASQQETRSESERESEDSDGSGPGYNGGNDGPLVRSLEDRLVNLWMLLLTHETAARRYSSPLVSFCAMLSIQPTTGSWMKPGNFSSDLSKMIWVVQLIIFYYGAQRGQEGDGRTLTSIQECCLRYLHQGNETPMGEILRWRLLLFHIRDHSVGDRQVEWNEQEAAITFEGTTLRMDHIPSLLTLEYQQCRRILSEELMLHIKDFRHIFLDCPANTELLCGANRLLLEVIEQSEPLRQAFVVKKASKGGGLAWRESAMATFETHVQEFLQRLCVLVHVSSGQPIREPEFFSMMWRKTQRRRHITIRHERVMIYTEYGKQQQQQGLYQNSVRFLAQPIGGPHLAV